MGPFRHVFPAKKLYVFFHTKCRWLSSGQELQEGLIFPSCSGRNVDSRTCVYCTYLSSIRRLLALRIRPSSTHVLLAFTYHMPLLIGSACTYALKRLPSYRPTI